VTDELNQVLVEQKGLACHVTINRAKEHNTMTDVVMAQLRQALLDAESMEGVRAIVITGAGQQTFCAGGKLKPTADGSPFALEPGRFDNPVADLFRAMDRCNLPIIARVNGGAFGGGVGLGVFPMMILPLLMRVIPRRRLQEMCFLAERFSAEDALRMEIVNQVVTVEQLDSAVEALIAKLAANSPLALRMGRRAFSAMSDLSLADALNLAQALLPVMSQSEDTREGMKAFAEKRTPNWTNR